MLTERLKELMGMPISQIKVLPRSSSSESVDVEGHRIQIVTWCDQLSVGKFRVMVSVHRQYPLGFSSVIAAEGFTIDEAGTIQKLDGSEARALLR